MKKSFLSVFLCISVLGTFAIAKDYPAKPVSMIVAYSPGGGTDTAARVVSKYVKPYLKQRLVIKNKPGAGGQIGFTSLSTANNDGYTIGFINIPSIFLVKELRKNVKYNISDFETIANIQLDPVVLAVKADSPFKTFADFLEAAKKRTLNIGGDGPQSNNQLQLLIAQDKIGFKTNFVPYNGSGPSITATLGGQIDASVPSATSASNHVNNGRLRVLAVFADKPYEYLPGVPTISQASGVNVPSIGAALRGIAAPKNISATQKKFLENAFGNMMKDKEFLLYAKKTNLPLQYMNSIEFDTYLKKTQKEIKRYMHLLK